MEALERHSLAAEQRHGVALDAFRGVYARIAASPEAPHPAGRARMAADLERVAAAHMSAEDHMATAAVDEIARLARRDASRHLGVKDAWDDDLALSDALNASDATIWDETNAQISRDVNQTLAALSRLALRAQVLARSKGWSLETAHARLAFDEMRPHHFADRAGRRRPSAGFIRTLWRGELLELYNRSYLLILAASGETTARVWHPDPKNRHFGERIALEDPDAYDALRDEAFHPNARALVRAEAYFQGELA